MLIFTKSGHISEAALALCALKDLPKPRVVPVEGHLSWCHRCRCHLRGMQELVAALRVLARGTVLTSWRGRVIC